MKTIKKLTRQLSNLMVKSTKVIRSANYLKDLPLYTMKKNDQEGITEWFKLKGLTYVEHTPSIWSYV
jgi:hypothetical protein